MDNFFFQAFIFLIAKVFLDPFSLEQNAKHFDQKIKKIIKKRRTGTISITGKSIKIELQLHKLILFIFIQTIHKVIVKNILN